MIVKHTLEITAVCPADDKPDVYQCIVEANRVVPVETIIEAASGFKTQKMYQEDICQELHRQLACKVTLVGYHSGVLTEVSCG